MNTILPSGSHLPLSPVLYILPPFPKGLSMNFSAVRSGRFKYPLASPAPLTHISPATPTGNSFRSSFNIYTCELGTGLPMGTGASSASFSATQLVESSVFSVGPYPLYNLHGAIDKKSLVIREVSLSPPDINCFREDTS